MSASQPGTITSLGVDSLDIHEVIGHGQFGEVRRAVDKATLAQIAIKIIPKDKIRGPNFYSQLRRQIEIQSRLKHKNICQLFAYFHDEDHVYILLEYCKHGTLASEIHEKRQQLSDKKIASIFQQLIHAVAYMHERHIMHRDLKLENILLDEHFNIKISDFGCCRHHVKPNFKRRTTFCGTMEYICPEMIKEEPYTNSVDVYCIGIILYQLFFFTSPFLGSDEEETFKNIKQNEVTFKDQVRAIPSEAKDLIARLLDKDPRKRPSARSLFETEFITKYLYDIDKKPKTDKIRFTEDNFTRWKEEVGMSVNNESNTKKNQEDQPENDCSSFPEEVQQDQQDKSLVVFGDWGWKEGREVNQEGNQGEEGQAENKE